jgi:putative ABC transport system ATP-binding protein
MSVNAVHLEMVRFAYTPTIPVLDIEELCIPAGQQTFLHGPSGSGKTTLLSLISGVFTPQQGSVNVLGHELTALSASARDKLRGSQIGYIFQGFNLVPYLSVQENIALACELYPTRRARIVAPTLAGEVERLTRRLDIHTHLSTRITNLSVGQQQRVAIARAIIGSPSLVVADEPTSALDTDRREAFLTLLTEVIEESASLREDRMTLLFVSHDRSLAPRFDSILSLAEINQQAISAGAVDC